MSHTNSTANYKLPQFLSTDKPAWIADINPAMLAIDENLKVASDNASSGLAQAESAMQTATAANELAGEANDTATSALTKATNAETSITDVSNKLNTKSVPAVKGPMITANTSMTATSPYLTTIKFMSVSVEKEQITFIPIGSGWGFDLFTYTGNPLNLKANEQYYLGTASVRIQTSATVYWTLPYNTHIHFDGATTHVAQTMPRNIVDSMLASTQMAIWGTMVWMNAGVIVPMVDYEDVNSPYRL